MQRGLSAIAELLAIMYTALFMKHHLCVEDYFSFYQANLDSRINHLQNVDRTYPFFLGGGRIHYAHKKSVSCVYPDELQTRLFTKSRNLLTLTGVGRRRQNPTVIAQCVTFAGAFNIAAGRAVDVTCCTVRQHNVYHHAVDENISYTICYK